MIAIFWGKSFEFSNINLFLEQNFRLGWPVKRRRLSVSCSKHKMAWRLWQEEESFCLPYRMFCSHLFYNSIPLLIVCTIPNMNKIPTWARPTTWVGWSHCWTEAISTDISTSPSVGGGGAIGSGTGRGSASLPLAGAQLLLQEFSSPQLCPCHQGNLIPHLS